MFRFVAARVGHAGSAAPMGVARTFVIALRFANAEVRRDPNALLVTGPAALIARWAPTHLVEMGERLARSNDERLRNLMAPRLLAFRGFVHRCEIALRRLNGETADVDPAVTDGDADMRTDTPIAMREPILAVLRGGIDDAHYLAELDRETLALYGGRPLDAFAETVQAEIEMAEESARRLRQASEAFGLTIEPGSARPGGEG